MVEIWPALGESLAMADSRVGRDDDACAGEVGSPTQLDVVAVERDARIEPAERPEQIGAHEEARRRQHEHVAHRVVLLLVVLSGLDDGVDLTEAVETEADVLQQAWLVPVGQLGADDPGVGAEQFGDHRSDRVGSRSNVVVTHEEEAVVALDQAEHFVDGRSESVVGGEWPYERRRDDRTDPRRELGDVVVTVRGEQEQRAEVGIILGCECLERLVEPVAGLVYHHHGHDRRDELGVRLHDAPRLAGRYRHRRSPGVRHRSAAAGTRDSLDVLVSSSATPARSRVPLPEGTLPVGVGTPDRRRRHLRVLQGRHRSRSAARSEFKPIVSDCGSRRSRSRPGSSCRSSRSSAAPCRTGGAGPGRAAGRAARS